VIVSRTRQPETVVSDWLSKDTWSNAEEALAAGLVDEIAEPTPLRRVVECAPGSGPEVPGPTEQELLFQTWLTAFGPVAVGDKAAFGRELRMGFVKKVIHG